MQPKHIEQGTHEVNTWCSDMLGLFVNFAKADWCIFFPFKLWFYFSTNRVANFLENESGYIAIQKNKYNIWLIIIHIYIYNSIVNEYKIDLYEIYSIFYYLIFCSISAFI